MRPEFWTPSEYRANLIAPLGDVTSAMERTGCPVDPARLQDIADRARVEETRIRAELVDWAGRDMNFLSWQQLAKLLHTDSAAEGGLGLEPSPYCKKGQVDVAAGDIKTDDRALEWLAGHNPEHRAGLNNIRQMRRHQRAAAYAEDWIAKALVHSDGTTRLYPSFGLGSDHDTRPGAVTGRFAVKNPPLQQVPRAGGGPAGELRSAFVAPPGCLLVVRDWSQLEIVIMAHICALLFGRGLLAGRVAGGEDMHATGAKFIWGEVGGNAKARLADPKEFKKDPELKVLRDLTKIVRYAMAYGRKAPGLSNAVFMPDGEALGMERAELLVKGLEQFDPEIPQYQAWVRDWIEAHGSIISLFGRLVFLPGAKAHKQGDRNRAWRQALNFPFQSGGQEIAALSLMAIAADSELRAMGYVLSMTVHDEIIGWAPEKNAAEAGARVEWHMKNTVQLIAPLSATGSEAPNWGAAK